MRNHNLISKAACCLCLLMSAFAPGARSQEQTDSIAQAGTSAPQAKANTEEAEAGTKEATEALQKATQNPVASLISVPVQNNNNFGVEPGYRNQDVLNLQPVIPIGISKDWNLIIRWIAPIVYQPLPNQPGTPETGQYGLGDMVPSFFLSPRKPGKLIWGIGPVFQLPTATSTYLGQGKVGLGPTAVALMQPGHWTLGVLVNNVWSVAGSGSRPAVNQFLLQYFINYNLKKGWYITWQPTLTANWEAPSGSRMGSTVWWRRGKNYETWISTCGSHCTILWQRRTSDGNSGMDHASADLISVPQAKQGGAGDDHGEETQTVGTAAASTP